MKIIAKKKMRYPMALEREYAKVLVGHVKSNMAVIRSFKDALKKVLDMSVVFDEADDALSIVLAQIRERIEVLPSMRSTVNKMYAAVHKHAKKELESVFRTVFGSVPYMAGESTVRNDDDMQEMIDKEAPFEQLKRVWVQQNLDYIKSIDEEMLRKIQESMANEIIGTVERKELAKTLYEALERIADLETKRAVLIGRDQIGKLYGRIEEYQQRQLGIDEYMWVSAGDERVRPSHRVLNGETFSWKNPPAEGHPGHPIQCRCIADPIIDLDKIAMKPQPGTYAVVEVQPQIITSVADTKNFKELADFLQREYNITTSPTVLNLDFESCKTALQGIERIKKEFPRLEISVISTDKHGAMCAFFDNKICFNPADFFAGEKKIGGVRVTAKSALAGLYQGPSTGFHPKNSNLESSGAHEAGHLTEAYLIRKYIAGWYERDTAWRKGSMATRIIHNAVKSLKRKGYKKLTADFVSEVSGYATANRSECLAECVADIVANGDNASPLSLEVWDILKEEMR